jgi:Pentapeptide repeats (8 copies)
MVSLARILVFLLGMVSLGAFLLGLLMTAAPFLIPPAMELPGTVAEAIPPGCFSAFIFVFMLPFSLVPAALGWMVRERIVRPHDDAERLWWEMEPRREERLSSWMSFVTGLLLAERGRRGTPDDPVPLRLRSEIPRAFLELDAERSNRLYRFLLESGLEGSARDALARGASCLPDPRSAETSLPRGLVLTAAAGFSLLSAFFVLWAGLTCLTLAMANPLEAVGFDYGPAQFVIGLSFSLILALTFGLTAAGLFRLSRRAAMPFQQGGMGRKALSELVLRQTRDQLEALAPWKSAEDALSFVQRIARAVVLSAVSELNGEGRGELLRALFAAGWLAREEPLPLEKADFRAAALTGAALPGASLAGADLSGADLSSADLSEADLSRCALRGSDLRSCRLQRASLRQADLRSARLQRAGLGGADLTGALIDGANFWGAEMAGAELGGMQGTAEFFAAAESA